MTVPRLVDHLRSGIDAGHQIGAAAAWRLGAGPLQTLELGEASPAVPLTGDTLMLWMSAGKPLTAAAVLSLVDRGSVALDQPVAEVLPEFGQGGKEGITLRQVLTHTAGFRGPNLRAKPGGGDTADGPWPTAKRQALSARLEPRWTPGQDAGYHVHTAWDALGALVEAIHDRPLPEVLHRCVLQPCGMSRTYSSIPPAQLETLRPRMAALPDTDAGERSVGDQSYRDPDHAVHPRPGGNTWGVAADLVRFYDMLLERPGSPAGSGAVDICLSPETARQMTRRQREGLTDRTFKAVIDWGLGVTLNSRHLNATPPMYGFGRHASPEAFGHGGNQCAIGWADPAYGLTACVLFNGRPGEAVHQPRADAAVDALYEDLGLSSGG